MQGGEGHDLHDYELDAGDGDYTFTCYDHCCEPETESYCCPTEANSQEEYAACVKTCNTVSKIHDALGGHVTFHNGYGTSVNSHYDDVHVEHTTSTIEN